MFFKHVGQYIELVCTASVRAQQRRSAWTTSSLLRVTAHSLKCLEVPDEGTGGGVAIASPTVILRCMHGLEVNLERLFTDYLL